MYYMYVHITRCAEPRLRSCGRRDSQTAESRRTMADTSDVMRRNFANKQIRGSGMHAGYEQSIQRTGRAEFQASDRAVPRSKANLVNN